MEKKKKLKTGFISELKSIGDKDLVMNFDKKSTQINELMLFKKEMLKEIKETVESSNKKMEIEILNKNLEELNKKINSLEQKISYFSESSIKINSFEDKISNLEKFRIESKEILTKNEFNINKIGININNIINKYDKIIDESIYRYNMIGKTQRFKKFSELINFIFLNVDNLLKENKANSNLIDNNKNNLIKKFEEFQIAIQTDLAIVKQFSKAFTQNIENNLNNRINNLENELKTNLDDKAIKEVYYEQKIDNLILNTEKDIKDIKSLLNENKDNIQNCEVNFNNSTKKIDSITKHIKNIENIVIDLLQIMNMKNLILNDGKINENENIDELIKKLINVKPFQKYVQDLIKSRTNLFRLKIFKKNEKWKDGITNWLNSRKNYILKNKNDSNILGEDLSSIKINKVNLSIFQNETTYNKSNIPNQKLNNNYKEQFEHPDKNIKIYKKLKKFAKENDIDLEKNSLEKIYDYNYIKNDIYKKKEYIQKNKKDRIFSASNGNHKKISFRNDNLDIIITQKLRNKSPIVNI